MTLPDRFQQADAVPDDLQQLEARLAEAEDILLRDSPQAEATAREVLAGATAAGCQSLALRSRTVLGRSLAHQKRNEQATELLESVVAESRSAKMPELLVHAWLGLGLAHLNERRMARGLQAYLEALKICESLNAPELSLRVLTNLASAYAKLEQYDTAQPYLTEAHDTARQLGQPFDLMITSLNLACVCQLSGGTGAALTLIEEALRHAKTVASPRYLKSVLFHFSQLLLDLDRLSEALTYCEQGLNTDSGFGTATPQCELQVTHGEILYGLGRPAEARPALEAGLRAAQDLRLNDAEGRARRCYAQLLEDQDDYQGALAQVRALAQLEHDLREQLAAVNLQLEAERLRSETLAEKRRLKEEGRTQQRLAAQLRHDALTGLPNRLALHEALGQQVAADSAPFALLCLDLDHFKTVNHTLGQPAGDALLLYIGERVQAAVGEQGQTFRRGGNEFVVLLPAVRAAPDALTIAQTLLDTINEPLLLDGQALVVTASIGLALFPEDGRDSLTLQKNADLALHAAKQEGGQAQRYRNALSQAANERLELTQALRSGIGNGELVLHYQPIVEVRSGKTVAVEALVRWQHPRLGLLSPDRFIGLAEDNGLIVPLGRWVLNTALRQLAAWREHWPELRVSVNMAPRQLQQPGSCQEIRDALRAYALPPDALELEITEQTICDEEALEPFLPLIREGLRLAIDDFGTGYSSLSRLYRLPAQILKLDRSLIQDLSADNATDGPLVSALIAFAQRFGMQVTAEGIETAEQLHLLRQ
ncbi:EAL domain-containing protein [Deinococcus radiodurans]|jgi:diguanylate cyclase (GGDEF) domain|nr:EAL domain-containing protein [Deinococcus radiodurans]ANC71261.1 hypothetical protein A2G07_05450 [Deinococcus radiodurans R1 = ATCC 13939 = DSM 20539]QIP29612.1 EAL domain-containing protein [Deinococcus radiodurans]QIP31701.1 EAL domain-containing protein [Deinococcus radiodurans]UID70602.1 c-di-GMP phosphodiesterase A [Deinococcus radiodurans R1 = ATCC 13939 = DSM 20539]